MVLRLAIQRHRQNSCNRCLTDPTMSTEDVTVRNSSLLDGVPQRPRDVILADNIGESLGPVFTRENLITHGGRTRLYGAKLWNGEALCEIMAFA